MSWFLPAHHYNVNRIQKEKHVPTESRERAFGDYHQIIVKNAKKNVNAISIPIHMKKPITPPKCVFCLLSA